MPTDAVLIVDDDIAWSETAAAALRAEGFAVHLAHDGEQGAAMLEKDSPAVVVLDVRLPRLSGVELLRSFRQRDLLTPVVMISGDDQAAIQDRAMAEGASAFLRKPLALSLLVRAVKRQIEVSARRTSREGWGASTCGT